MFKEYPGKIAVKELEEEILRFWDEHKVFEKTLEWRKDHPNFVFYEGPPTANGRPGIHHVMSRTIKDVVCRYKTQTGHFVYRKAGWDTHGLPVEIEVEKELGIQGKEDIEKYGVARFNQKCRESVFRYKKDWDDLTRRIGYWLDLEHPYITFENEYIQSVWWILKTFFDRGLLYQGFKILPYCPRCETPLSSHEVSLGYREVPDPSIYVKVPLRDEPDTYFLVWTTTPWTLISNVALAVHPEVTYVKVAYHGEKLILAEARLQAVLEDDFQILERMPGKKLEGIRYQRLFDYVPVDKEAFYVVLGDFVTVEDGTGIVHIAPAFGEDDFRVGQKYNLPVLRPVDKSGRFEPVVEDFKGQFVKDADPQIIERLKKAGLLFRAEQMVHSYPHCWRCDRPLLYYARESWYLKTTQFKENMLQHNQSIHWHPPEVGKGRFGEWLKNNVDWALSRDRYWGTPLNIWFCQQCGHQQAVASIAELKELGADLPEPIDLHKPYVDEVHFPCPKCSATMHRVPEVIDCWFDSGSMPYAQWGYPFKNQDQFEKNYPADFICEGIDQTRGWFYSLLAISTLLFDRAPYKNVVVNELILDKEGQKMSKSRGNVVYPYDVIDRYGVDPLRWYFLTVNAPWVPKRFDIKGVEEVYRKYFDTLLNTYNFFALYANVDRFDPAGEPIPLDERQEIDRWILSRLYTVVAQVREHMEAYEMTRATRLMQQFLLDDVSNWYVRRNRRRFWKSENSRDKLAAYQTLYEVLLTLSKLTAPFTPFVAEVLYQNLRRPGMAESVHLTDYPAVGKTEQAARDEQLEWRMAQVQQIVRLARALRNQVKIKVRQPLPRLVVSAASRATLDAIAQMAELIKEEVNVKRVELTDRLTELITRRAKPNYKTLGPRYGKLMKQLAGMIANWGEEEISRLEEQGQLHVPLNGQEATITPSDVEIIEETRGALVVARDGDLVVGLDTTLTPDLELEGLAREFVNRIQNLRKNLGLEVTDRIVIYYQGPEKIHQAVQMQADYIKTETLATDLFAELPKGKLPETVKIAGHSVLIVIEKNIHTKEGDTP
ncbi:MAG: isoleucine--tRNA ligase [Calditrichaeota bacterium]|nr:MAG: isoleucine--tRNA ligase [Calditrichota bacterium]